MRSLLFLRLETRWSLGTAVGRLPMIDVKMLKVYLKTMIEMWAGWLGDCARGELKGSIRQRAKAVDSRSGTSTCRPLLSVFCCSSKTRLLCKTFFNKYYKMGAAQKPKLFTRKTIKLVKRQIKTNKATQLKTLKNVNCRSPPFVTRWKLWFQACRVPGCLIL